MEMRTLGASGIKVSAIGLGLMSMSGIYGNANDEESVRVIHYALDKGINLLDSADMYGWGHNEELLGRALRGRRDGVVVATKFGQVKLPDGKQGVDGSPAYVMRACDASLRRLGINVIDLYYQHRVDPNVPIEETVGAMKRLVEAGKVRAIGLSEAQPATIRRAHKIHPIAAVQNEYSLLYRVEGEETLETTRELGIVFVAYAPLGRSMLTGSVKGKADLPDGDRRLAHPRFQGDSLDKNVKIVKRLEDMAAEKKCTPAQLVLAWLLAQGKDIVPIPGTKRKQRVDENLDALEVRLSAADVKHISDIAPPGAGAGLRYPADALKRVYL
ncbi:MAG TPA: aldo/keto reductase [Burkholderiales bacterium]|nr:aldo/keto reductase [Burkholderiales bacterium]